MLSDVGGGGLASVSDVQSLVFILKKNEFVTESYVIGRNSSVGLWHQTTKSFFNDTIALFMG